MAPHVLTDAELLEQLKMGDHAAFGLIYKRYWALLYRTAYKMLEDPDDAADAVQEIFTMLWEKAPDIELNGAIAAYLYTSLRNRVISRINRDKLGYHYAKSLADFMAKGTTVTDDQIRERELAQQIEKEIAALPPKMREVFELSRKQYLSYKEIAEVTELSEGTVKKQVYNALKTLRFKLGAWSAPAILTQLFALLLHRK